MTPVGDVLASQLFVLALIQSSHANMTTIDATFRQRIHIADRYARTKEYPCLVPGCGKKAIRSHAVPRALLIEAIAEDKHLYTQPASFIPTMRMTAPTDPIEIERVGINKASVFRGFCSDHDRILFAPAEIRTKKWHATGVSLHLRAISFEYSRKRLVRDYHTKFASLIDDPRYQAINFDLVAQFESFLSAFEMSYLQAIMSLIGGSPIDIIDYFTIPFCRNLGVSCCGLFQSKGNDFSSAICYNLISYKNASSLTLTAFRYKVDHLEEFLSEYKLSRGAERVQVELDDIERLVNDIAFFHCEEPLISPRLWRSLSEEERLAVRYSMRPPGYRTETAAPRAIKIGIGELFTRRNPS